MTHFHPPMRALAAAGLFFLAGCFTDTTDTQSAPPDPVAGWLPDSVFTATWAGGARAAWSIIFDDFCGGWARGIQDKADTMFRDRGMAFSFAIIPGQCDEGEWEEARRLVGHGHKPANLTMNQFCAVAESWCPTSAFGPEDYPLELDSSAAWIERETGVRPAFMAFPYDLWTPELLDALRQRHYLGARASTARGKVNPADIKDGFDVSWDLEFPPENKQWQSFTLRGYYRAALDQGGWAFQSAHGVSDQSYGSIEEDSLRALLDEMKPLVDSGTLWVAPPTDVIAYSLLRQSVAPAMEATGKEAIINWIPMVAAPLADKAARDLYDTELTLVLRFKSVPAGLRVAQGGADLPWRGLDSRNVQVRAKPGAGPLRLSVSAP
ncbi:MAG: hypothetical protein JWO30_1590 [Fibrobacteres bacterium]|nr:hypothetical protein [Fibrobacterota bacterium]